MHHHGLSLCYKSVSLTTTSSHIISSLPGFKVQRCRVGWFLPSSPPCSIHPKIFTSQNYGKSLFPLNNQGAAVMPKIPCLSVTLAGICIYIFYLLMFHVFPLKCKFQTIAHQPARNYHSSGSACCPSLIVVFLQTNKAYLIPLRLKCNALQKNKIK